MFQVTRLRKTAAIISFLAFATAASAQDFPVERCINLGAALEAPVEGEWGYVIQKRHIERIAQAGFDTVRLPVKFSSHFDDGQFDPDVMARVDEVLGWIDAQGLNAIVVMHHYWDLMDTGSQTHKTRLIEMWQTLGDHYASAPPSVMFELLNEPEDKLSTADAVALYQEIVADLRPSHPTRWVIMGGDTWNALDTLADVPLSGPYDVRTFHFYEPWEFTHQGAPYVQVDLPRRGWGDAEERARLDRRFEMAARASGPIFLGEFGVYDTAPRADHVRWLRAVREAADRHRIAWCHWGFTQGDQVGFQAFDTQREAWRADVLDALVGE